MIRDHDPSDLPDELSDSELDALLTAAHSSMLRHIQRHTDPAVGLLALMAHPASQPDAPAPLPQPGRVADAQAIIELRNLLRTTEDPYQLCRRARQSDLPFRIKTIALPLVISAAVIRAIAIAAVPTHRNLLRNFLGGPVHSLVHDLARDIDLALALDRDLAHALDLDLALALARDRSRGRALHLALDRALDRVSGLGLDLDWDLDSYLGFEHNLDRDRRRARERDRERDLSLVFTVARDLALALARDLVRDLALALGRALDRALTFDRAQAPALAQALNLAQVLDRDLTSTFDLACAQVVSLYENLGAIMARELIAIPLDVSGMDLSHLRVTDVNAVAGVMWTRSTIWCADLREVVEDQSEEIRPGVYKVRDGDEQESQSALA
ncbi:hypothetical protein [Herbidospora daliensis]|uniref:hypothetical protein n=1 Tax=Herbidospora daliensis TaxID=295585 RepID=UPI00078365A8|nr:hypothetical protein [Herbidospora daliensis]